MLAKAAMNSDNMKHDQGFNAITQILETCWLEYSNLYSDIATVIVAGEGNNVTDVG